MHSYVQSAKGKTDRGRGDSPCHPRNFSVSLKLFQNKKVLFEWCSLGNNEEDAIKETVKRRPSITPEKEIAATCIPLRAPTIQ